MRRRLFNVATVLSLVLLLATVALWVRSYMSDDAIEISRHVSAHIGRRMYLAFGSYDGTLGMSYSISQYPEFADYPSPVTDWDMHVRHGKPGRMKIPSWYIGRGLENGQWYYWHGFVFHYGTYSHVNPFLLDRVVDAGVPHSVIAIVCATVSLLLVRRVRWRAPQPGRCPACQYNLTGNVSGVCPECGSKVTA